MDTTTKTKAIAIECNVEAMTLTLTFGNGDTATLAANDLSKETRNVALLHGLKQKLGDGAALGKGSTVAEKQGAVLKVLDSLREGRWNAIRSAVRKGMGLLDLQTEAMGRYLASVGKERPADTVREKLKGMSQAQRAAYMASEAVAPFWAEVQAEQAADAAVDVEAF